MADRDDGETFMTLLSRQEPLDPDLAEHLFTIDGGVLFLHHPLVIIPLFAEGQNALANTQYRRKREAVAEALAAGNVAQVVALHEKPYRLDALVEHADSLDDRAFWDLVGDVWVACENIAENYDRWDELLHCARPHRDAMMSAEDRHALAAMPERLTVHRGFHGDGGQDGFSWTLDPGVAVKFAYRFAHGDRRPCVATGTVVRADVIAYLTGRNEQEIVCLPEHVHDMTVSAPADKLKA